MTVGNEPQGQLPYTGFSNPVTHEEAARAGAFHKSLKRLRVFAWFCAGGVIALCAGIPAVFALWDEDRLRMSDDFAAMTSAAIALILTLGFLEMERSLKRAHGRAEVELTARMVGVKPQHRTDAREAPYELTLWMSLVAVGTWIAASFLMGAALLLTFLWGAIDGHGPARWLAWYVLGSLSFGLCAVMIAVISKSVTDVYKLGWVFSMSMYAPAMRLLGAARVRMGPRSPSPDICRKVAG
ncbi:hypothetical protein ACIHCV_43410 [Streptomyces sp. NPDC051956]|uniref:hypothetical protein n=1 Tax=Streptomyces sp. NPDC051956 TaxID=3365677 RepID=UPI0037D577A4